MTTNTPDRVPHSPEVEPPAVREQLDQENVTHEGRDEAVRDEAPDQHLGANETEVTPIRAPMRGPENLVGDGAAGDSSAEPDGEELIDPADEITPG
jgi:hypothetical protein